MPIVILLANKIEASSFQIKSSSDIVGIDEQFYIDIMLDAENRNINGIESYISFPEDKIKFVRYEDGKSMVNLWVEKPYSDSGKIKFSGVMLNGFSGVINPFNPDVKLPGLITRLVFEPKNSGQVDVSIFDSYVTLNDGYGTAEKIPSLKKIIIVQDFSNKYVYNSKSNFSPEISAYIVREKNLYNNHYVLVFDAKDNENGIKEVLIKEGRRDWKAIESPYLLEDQSRHSIITLQATNYSGSSIVLNIESLPKKIFSIKNISIIILILLVSVFIFKKAYEKYK